MTTTVSASITADSSQLQRAVNEANSSLASLRGEFRNGISTAAKYTAATTAAGVALSAYLIKNSIDAAKEISNLARVAGTSAEQFQGMAFAARGLGVEQDKLADILKDVNDKVGDFLTTGSGGMTDFFEQIAPKVGVTAEQFRNLSGPQALQLYVSTLEKANLSQAEMTFHMEAIASDSTLLIPLLRDGGKALAEQAAQAERLGLVLSDIDITQMKQASAQMSIISSVMDAYVDNVAARFAPVISAMGKQLIGLAEDAGGVAPAAEKSFNAIIEGAAFAANAVQGLSITFQLAGKKMAKWALEAQLATAKASGSVSDIAGPEVIGAVETGLNKILVMFGGVPVEAEKAFRGAASQVPMLTAAIEEAQKDIDKTLSAPLDAGERFKKFVADAVIAGESAAAALNVVVPPPSVGGGMNAADAKAAEAHKKQLAERIERIKEANMLEAELAQLKFEEEQAFIAEAWELGQISDQERKAVEEDSLQTHQANMTNILARSAASQVALEREKEANKKAVTQQAWAAATSLMDSGSKTLFKIGKAAAISKAVIDTISGINSALALGPWGIPLAAVIGAAGFANVQKIKSQSFGSSGAGAGAVPSDSGSSPGDSVGGSGGSYGGGGSGPLRAEISGLNSSDIFTGAQVSDLFDKLSNEAGDRGFTLGVRN